tara:strand:+ start:713 stop:1195 length:483 start_codon:yes stop_codon:yes gene_type:complete
MNPRIYESGQVARYHCNPRMSLFRQTNADHQWGCVILILQLHPDPSINLIRAAATHDCGEIDAGDLSHPVKRSNPEHAAAHDALEAEKAEAMGVPRPQLTNEEARWLKLADRLESFLYMKMYGTLHQWQLSQIQELLDRASELGVTDQVCTLMELEEVDA